MKLELTKQCKEFFEKWYIPYIRKQRPDYVKFTDEEILRKFYRKIDSEKYGVYEDFFDSVGIVIGLNSTIRLDKNQIFRVYVNKVKIDPHPKTRPEARTAAIKKANEIYNQRTKPDQFRVC